MSFQSWSKAFKKEKGKKVIGAVAVTALLVGGAFASQYSDLLSASIIDSLPATISNSGLTPIKNIYIPDKRKLADVGTALSVQKLVAVGAGDFQDANDSDTAVMQNGEEIKYLIHVNNLGTVVSEFVDASGNTSNYPADANVTIQDIFPTNITDFGRHVTCWYDSRTDSTSPASDSYTLAECSYSEMSQRFFNSRTTIHPDLFYLRAPDSSDRYTHFHILVTGNYVQTPSLFNRTSDVNCNVVTVDGGRDFGVVEDDACVRTDNRLFIAPIVRTPIGKPTIPAPIPEPDFQLAVPAVQDMNSK